MIWYFAGINFVYYLIWSYSDRNISESIISGDMVIRLAKPITIMKWEFSKAVSFKVCGFLFEFLPSLIIYTIIVFPDFLTYIALLKFIIICMFSFVLFYLLNFLIGLSAFRMHSTESLQILKIIIFNLAAGAFIPLEFYPDFLQEIIKILPFQYICYVPIQFLLNKKEILGWNEFIYTIIIETFWIIIFYILYKIFWRKAIKYFSVAGG